jgi:hypothetical protein
MGEGGRQSDAKNAGCASSACSASDECPYRVWSSAGDGSLSSGLGLGAAAGVGASAAAQFGSGVGALRTAVLVESARVDHVGWCERGRRGRDDGDGKDAGGAAEEGGGRLAGR